MECMGFKDHNFFGKVSFALGKSAGLSQSEFYSACFVSITDMLWYLTWCKRQLSILNLTFCGLILLQHMLCLVSVLVQ